VNAEAPPLEWPTLGQAERRVREIQATLHRWAGEDSGRRFQDVFNLFGLATTDDRSASGPHIAL
jgi:hypothetical protein